MDSLIKLLLDKRELLVSELIKSVIERDMEQAFMFAIRVDTADKLLSAADHYSKAVKKGK